MKRRVKSDTTAFGFTLLEILMSILVLGVSVSVFLIGQRSLWSSVEKNNRFLVAGQIIGKQIEWRRMTIARDTSYYNTFKVLTDTTIVDNSVQPPVTVVWTMSPAIDPNGMLITNVRNALLTASWGSGPKDTLRVTTCIARDF